MRDFQFFKLPFMQWLKVTIAAMNSRDSVEIDDWRECWVEAYVKLGGTSCKRITGRLGSGDKECPMHAAWGLWRMNRIRAFANGAAMVMHPKDILMAFGPNALYAVIAANRLFSIPDTVALKNDDFWAFIQSDFLKYTGESAAGSNQGSMTVVKGLHGIDQLVMLQT
ncbi:hypothetical protein BH11PLA2_BH11PLA2_47940 [soil metagenome]